MRSTITGAIKRFFANRKLFDLLCIKFLVTLNFALIQTTKDTLVITAGGAETIPILKGGPVVVLSLFVTWLYSRLSKTLTRESLFQGVLGFFIVFFSIYALILMPHREFFTPQESVEALREYLGPHRDCWISVYENWIDSLFFVVTELWSTMVLLVSFWGFANHISSVEDAKNFYGLIPFAGHVSLVIGGILVAFISSNFLNLSFQSSVQIILFLFCISTFLAIFLYRGSYKRFGRDVDKSNALSEIELIETGQKKPDISFIQSLKQIWLNPFLRTIAIITICFSFCINMIEVGWKAYMKIYFNDAKDYQAFMGFVSSGVGFCSIIFSIFIGKSIIKKCGWYFSAQLTPIVAIVVTAAFCLCYFFNSFYPIPILVVILGAVHNIAFKVMKLSLFDPTREMIYIPLDDNAKIRGKAAIDVFCFRLGKSSSSWVQLLLIEIVGLGSFLAAFDAVFVIVGVCLFMWFREIRSIKKAGLID